MYRLHRRRRRRRRAEQSVVVLAVSVAPTVFSNDSSTSPLEAVLRRSLPFSFPFFCFIYAYARLVASVSCRLERAFRVRRS